VDESIDVSDTTKLSNFFRGIDMEFSITDFEGATIGADVYEEAKNMLQDMCIPREKLVRLVTNGAPSMAERNSGESPLIISDVNNATDYDLITYH
jgi:hypothetical protein